MKIVSFERAGQWLPGMLIDDWVIETCAVAEQAGWSAAARQGLHSNRQLLGLTTESFAQLVAAACTHLDALRAERKVWHPSEIRLGPPISDPQKIICIGLNYHDHAAEVAAAAPDVPILFAKYANSLIGPTDAIVPPRDTQKVDYEAELAVVIGRRGRYIDPDRALAHVAGAMIFNDVSARDLQLATQTWMGGKAIDTFGPCGPALVTLDEIADLGNLAIRTRVNGELRQNGSTRSMIFPVPALIAFISRIMTLEPGDIIATGTPAGVGTSFKPGKFLQRGDLVEVEIEGLGMLRNRIAEAV